MELVLKLGSCVTEYLTAVTVVMSMRIDVKKDRIKNANSYPLKTESAFAFLDIFSKMGTSVRISMSAILGINVIKSVKIQLGITSVAVPRVLKRAGIVARLITGRGKLIVIYF